MPKHRLRESIKTFFGSHIDPGKDEELKGTKTGILLRTGHMNLEKVNNELWFSTAGKKMYPAFDLLLANQKICILQIL